MSERWTPWSAPMALIAALGVTLVGGTIVGGVAAATGSNLRHLPPVVDIVSTLIQDGALVLVAVLFAARVARPTAAAFGLRRVPRPVRALGLLLGAWALFVAFSGAWTTLLNVHDKEKIVDQLGANDSAVALVAVSALTCVVAPLCEELFFRGYFFTALRNWHGTIPAALLCGLVFGGIHAGSAPVGYLVPLAFFGFVLCLLYRATSSLYPCIVLHALNNSVAFGVTEHWSWQIPVLAAASLASLAVLLGVVARTPSAQ
ncbi:MAG: CPBP family intramembrane glutamic endopeptidase [Solirubrobacteraceae bacterium]